MSASKSAIVALIVSSLYSTAFHIHDRRQHSSWSMRSRSEGIPDEDENQNMFNDFGDMVIGGGQPSQSDYLLPSDNESDTEILQTRVNLLINQEHEEEERIIGNWKRGHWSVRGCSLDPGDEDEKILISSICAIDDSSTVLVGRTDGSVFWLQLGEDEYMAKFVNRLAAKEGKNDSIQVTKRMKREDIQKEDISESLGDFKKFQILSQVKVSEGGIILMIVDDEYLVCATSCGKIEYWKISEDEAMSEESKILREVPSSVVSLRTQSLGGNRFLICICSDGHVLVWDIGSNLNLVVSRELSTLETPDDTIISFHSDDTYSYFGTSQGLLVVYNTRDILSSCMGVDSIKWFAPFADGFGGVSAIASSQENTFAALSQLSMTLVVGSTNGNIKQYELIPRENGALEHWPRMKSQSIPGKCHIFASKCEEPVLALKIMAETILAATSEQLTLWNPETGEALFDMLGLDFISTQPSLVLIESNSALITNGMKHLLCLHDFSEEELDIDESFEAI